MERAQRAQADTRGTRQFFKLRLLNAEILLAQGRKAEARGLLEEMPPAILPSPELKARALLDQVQLRIQSNRPDEAWPILAQVRDLASETTASSFMPSVELKRGLLLDDFDQKDAAFHRAAELAQRQHDESITAQSLGNIGYIRMARFRYDEAIPWFEAADQAAQKIPSKLVHEQNLGNLGWCNFRLGQSDRALDLLSRALKLASGLELQDDQLLWLGDIGVIYYSRDDFDKAVFHYSQALNLAQRLGNKVEIARWASNIARAYIDQKRWDEAEKYNRLALAGKPGDEVAPYLQLNAGLIATARGQRREAQSALHKAIELAEKTHQPNVEWQAHSGLAELYGAKDRGGAAQEYAATIAVLDREWLALSRDNSKITFRSYLGGFYQDYVGFLAEQGQKEKALEVAESSRARLLMQKLDGRTSALPAFNVADAVRLARQTDCVLLSYWLAKSRGASPQTVDRSYLWAVTAKGVSQFVLPAESAIDALIEQHRRSIENLEDPLSSGGSAARQLYRTLLGPARPLLKQASRVIIVPDGRLHEINFETLVADEPAPHYWIEDATVALAPSLGVLRSQPARVARTPRLLIIGDPLPADPEFPPLLHLKTEIREIASGFAASDRAVYAGADAYPGRLGEADPQTFTAIHFAAHATANEESPLNSAIVLSRHGDAYKLYASDVAGLRLDPELVTISACRSAGAKAYSGEGLIGFSWAFLNSGAHNVVAGIWNVDDAAAPMLMKEFYQEWRGGTDPAAALRGAKLQLMRSGGAFRKPYYWGPFEVFTRQATRSAIDLAWRNKSK